MSGDFKTKTEEDELRHKVLFVNSKFIVQQNLSELFLQNHAGNIQVVTPMSGFPTLLTNKPIMIFGRDVLEIKCFRDSFICGFCTSVAGGLGTFLFTSKPLFSTHMAFASLWIGVFAYWIPCRHKFESEVLLFEELRKKQKESDRKKKAENALKSEE